MTKAEYIANAILDDLADANHPIWLTGTVGLDRNPANRWSNDQKGAMIARIQKIIEDAS